MSEPKTKQEKNNWMKKHMPEALEMMREGIKAGLTFGEPQNLKIKKVSV